MIRYFIYATAEFVSTNDSRVTCSERIDVAGCI